jgi:hypothetical protein
MFHVVFSFTAIKWSLLLTSFSFCRPEPTTGSHCPRKCERPRWMLSHFPPADHFHPAAVHFHHQASTFQSEVQGPPTEAVSFETAGREISLLPPSRQLRTFLFTIPFYPSIPISLLSYHTSYITYKAGTLWLNTPPSHNVL